MTPHGIVEIEGLRWDSWKHTRLFSRLNVEMTTGEASQATWEVFDPEYRLINKYSIANGVSFSTIRVWLGFGPELGEPVFKGLLARVERNEAKTIFRVYDMSFKMRLIQKTEYHKGTDLTIIKKLVERNGLKFEGPSNPLKLEPHASMPQDEQTDWEHAAERAHESGLLLFTRHDTVFAKYPVKVGAPKITLVNRQHFNLPRGNGQGGLLLRDFEMAFKVPENQTGKPKKVSVRGRGRGGKRLVGESTESRRGHEQLSIKKDLSKHTKKNASARAQAQRELDREHAFEGYIRALSFPDADGSRLDVRDTLRIWEVGKLFSGDYVANKVTHDLTPARLTTSYDIYRDVTH